MEGPNGYKPIFDAQGSIIEANIIRNNYCMYSSLHNNVTETFTGSATTTSARDVRVPVTASQTTLNIGHDLPCSSENPDELAYINAIENTANKCITTGPGLVPGCPSTDEERVTIRDSDDNAVQPPQGSGFEDQPTLRTLRTYIQKCKDQTTSNVSEVGTICRAINFHQNDQKRILFLWEVYNDFKLDPGDIDYGTGGANHTQLDYLNEMKKILEKMTKSKYYYGYAFNTLEDYNRGDTFFTDNDTDKRANRDIIRFRINNSNIRPEEPTQNAYSTFFQPSVGSQEIREGADTIDHHYRIPFEIQYLNSCNRWGLFMRSDNSTDLSLIALSDRYLGCNKYDPLVNTRFPASDRPEQTRDNVMRFSNKYFYSKNLTTVTTENLNTTFEPNLGSGNDLLQTDPNLPNYVNTDDILVLLKDEETIWDNITNKDNKVLERIFNVCNDLAYAKILNSGIKNDVETNTFSSTDFMIASSANNDQVDKLANILSEQQISGYQTMNVTTLSLKYNDNSHSFDILQDQANTGSTSTNISNIEKFNLSNSNDGDSEFINMRDISSKFGVNVGNNDLIKYTRYEVKNANYRFESTDTPEARNLIITNFNNWLSSKFSKNLPDSTAPVNKFNYHGYKLIFQIENNRWVLKLERHHIGSGHGEHNSSLFNSLTDDEKESKDYGFSNIANRDIYLLIQKKQNMLNLNNISLERDFLYVPHSTQEFSSILDSNWQFRTSPQSTDTPANRQLIEWYIKRISTVPFYTGSANAFNLQTSIATTVQDNLSGITSIIPKVQIINQKIKITKTTKEFFHIKFSNSLNENTDIRLIKLLFHIAFKQKVKFNFTQNRIEFVNLSSEEGLNKNLDIIRMDVNTNQNHIPMEINFDDEERCVNDGNVGELKSEYKYVRYLRDPYFLMNYIKFLIESIGTNSSDVGNQFITLFTTGQIAQDLAVKNNTYNHSGQSLTTANDIANGFNFSTESDRQHIKNRLLELFDLITEVKNVTSYDPNDDNPTIKEINSYFAGGSYYRKGNFNSGIQILKINVIVPPNISDENEVNAIHTHFKESAVPDTITAKQNLDNNILPYIKFLITKSLLENNLTYTLPKFKHDIKIVGLIKL